MIQIPVKKVFLHFVDLKGRYEYDKLLKQLSPIIYGEEPITRDEQLGLLLRHLEDRKLEVIKKYGDYPNYCESAQEIPIPYEFVFFFNDYFKKNMKRSC